ncbi:hypothetical protein [Nocardiopsis halotolerans]|uniref:hypothetical protein n=1 Tax=Nocardiopsis halotolerans TaxID=124252 RepID=UPI000348CD3B|nr:hypothetical protein [Nocardiopsis halotolerans]
MSINALLSLIVLVAVLGVVVSIFAGGVAYVGRVRRDGPAAVLAGARRRREMRD